MSGDTLLYKIKGGVVEFRRQSAHCDTLSTFLPDGLKEPVDFGQAPTEREVERLVSRTGWVGRAFNAETEPGSAFLGKRAWDLGAQS